MKRLPTVTGSLSAQLTRPRAAQRFNEIMTAGPATLAKPRRANNSERWDRLRAAEIETRIDARRKDRDRRETLKAHMIDFASVSSRAEKRQATRYSLVPGPSELDRRIEAARKRCERHERLEWHDRDIAQAKHSALKSKKNGYSLVPGR
jgi:hypothetical protein